MSEKLISSNIQGDVSYELRQGIVTQSYVDFTMKLYSTRLDFIDIIFEYRFSSNDDWRSDGAISCLTAKYIKNNRILGLSTNQYGNDHVIRWNYSENNVIYSSSMQIKVKLLPRLDLTTSVLNKHTLSSYYGDGLIEFNGIFDNKCIGIDQYHRYMCVDDDSFFIVENLDDITTLHSYDFVSDPKHAINIANGNYIVCDYSNNRVIELDSELSAIVKTYSINKPVYVDYSENNETLLITSESLNSIYEITWSDIDTGTLIWQSTYSLNSPSCATYKQDNVNFIVIADYGNNRVIKYNKIDNSYESIYFYKIGVDYTGPYDISSLQKPYRVNWYYNGNISIIERYGIETGLQLFVSSSTSSSSVSESSSSSSIDSSSSTSSSGSSNSSSSSSSSSNSSSSSIDSSSSSSSDITIKNFVSENTEQIITEDVVEIWIE